LQKPVRAGRMRTGEAPVRIQTQALAAAYGKNVEAAAPGFGADGSAALEQPRIRVGKLRD